MSFYDEKKELEEEFDEELGFEFLENTICGDIHILLHGYCYIFAEVLKFYNPSYKICYLYDNTNVCIHAWCEDNNGNFIDVRGKTSDIDEFFDEFADWYSYEYPCEESKIKKFKNLKSYNSFLKKKLSLSEECMNETEYIDYIDKRVFANDVYLAFENYYKELK